jgi:glycosyltransferase involved in cell wall biosynthesis
MPVVLLYTRFFEFSQERLYRVFAGIYHRVPAVRFLVVGKGRNCEEELLARAAQEHGFGEALLMAGWLEPEEIKKCLAAADVAVYPLDDTLINRAKCPAKLTELLVAGVAVVADRVGQAAEYIQPRHSGILCDPESADEMIEEVVGLILDPQLRLKLGEAGRFRLLECFNWSTAAARLDKFYLNLVKQ